MYRPCKYNKETREQLWMSAVGDTHDNFCSCETPYAHALWCMFPEGHKDRNLTIQQIIDRDSTCLSGGNVEISHGLADTGEEEQGNIPPDEGDLEDLEDTEIEELIAAADAATER